MAETNSGEPRRRFTEAELRELNIRAGESFARMFLRTVEVQQQGKKYDDASPDELPTFR